MRVTSGSGTSWVMPDGIIVSTQPRYQTGGGAKSFCFGDVGNGIEIKKVGGAPGDWLRAKNPFSCEQSTQIRN